tara:strand:+ start:1149 stop:1397 length:249 start_codon:yes stop_codon:yes gene_type:complete
MTYKKLAKLLPNDEIHYIQDSIQNPDDSIDLSEFNDESKYEFILYEFTMESIPETIKILIYNNISFNVKYDELNQLYIVINK